MKRILATLFMLVTVATIAHGQEQSGIPAKLTAANGRQFPVFLQGMNNDKIVFQLYKKNQNREVPARLIRTIEFVGRLDTDGIEQLYNTGDYQGMINKMKMEMKPSLDDYWQFMIIENSLQDHFTMLMKAYLRVDDVSQASKAAAILLQNDAASVRGQAESIAILAALGEERVADAESMLDEVDSAPGKLYLGACIERAKGQYKVAIQRITELIAQYPNDLSWMPQAELLNARLYMDMAMTNSAIATARQVKAIYANSDAGNVAAALYDEYVLAKQKADEAAKAKAEAEAAAMAEVKARAKERAEGYGFDESESLNAETDTVDQAESGDAGETDVDDEAGTE